MTFKKKNIIEENLKWKYESQLGNHKRTLENTQCYYMASLILALVNKTPTDKCMQLISHLR